MFALCVVDTWINKVIGVLDRSDDLDYIIGYALEIYDSQLFTMWCDALVLECDENGIPDVQKKVGYVAYSLDPQTGYKTRIDPVFVRMPKYKMI